MLNNPKRVQSEFGVYQSNLAWSDKEENVNFDVVNPHLKNNKLHSCVSKGNFETFVGHFALIFPPGLV